MKHRSQWLVTSALVVAVLALPALAAGITYYVDPAGNDLAGANDCTQQGVLACKTITHAATKAVTGIAGSPDVIQVAAGTYSPDVLYTGEVFPIIFANDYVSLIGAGAASTTIDTLVLPATTSDALDIGVRGVSVSGFTFSNAGTAIDIEGQGGYTISNNIFTDTVYTGVYAAHYNSVDNVSYTVDPISFTDNTFASTDYGVDFKVGLGFDRATAGLTAAIGAITVTGNTFNCDSDGFIIDELYIRDMASGTATVGDITVTNNNFNDCSTGLELDPLYIEAMDDSTVTWGNVTVDNDTFTNNDSGVNFYGWFGSDSGNDLNSTNVTQGNVSVSNNTFTDNSGEAIELDYFDVTYLNGTSTVILGDLTIHNNTIEADLAPVAGYGIYISDIGYIEELYDSAAVTTGTIAITDNSIESHQEALYLYNEGVYYIGNPGDTDTVDVNFGAITVSGNDLSSDSDLALYFYNAYLGYEQYADTTVDAGLITVHDNQMTTTGGDDGLYFYYLYESGYYMGDNAQLTIAGLTFTNNTISVVDSGDGAYFQIGELGYEMYNNAKVTVGPSNIAGNTITAVNAALYLYFEETGSYMYDSSMVTMSPWTIDNNTLTSTHYPDYAALTVYYDSYDNGAEMYGDSSLTMPDWSITNNMIDVKGDYDGIYYYTYSNPDDNYDNAAVHYGSMLIDNNTINEDKDGGMENGIYLYLDDVCEGCYDSSSFSHGDITVTNNSIYNAQDTGIEIWYGEVGYEFDDDSQVTMGDVTIADNLVDTADYGIYIDYDDLGSEASAVVSLGTLDITGNTLQDITQAGMLVDIDGSLGDPTASLSIGQTTISDNTVAASATPDSESAGIWMNADIGTGVVFAAPEVNANSVSGFTIGLGFDDLAEASMRCNTVENNSDAGLFFISDGNFTAIYNSLVDNGLGLKIGSGDTATVTAEKNWWGDVADPGAKIDAGGGTVDFDPWLSSAPTSQCGGYVFPWAMFMPACTGAGTR